MKIRPRAARSIVQCCMLLLAAFFCGSVVRPERIRSLQGTFGSALSVLTSAMKGAIISFMRFSRDFSAS